MKKVLKAIWKVCGWIYFPVYVVFCILHMALRLLLSLTYFGLLNFYFGKQVLKSVFMFRYYGEKWRDNRQQLS